MLTHPKLRARGDGFSRRHRRLVIVVAIVAGLALGPVLALWLRHSMHEARASAAAERSSLDEQQREFAASRARLAAAASELSSVTVQRAAARAELARIQGSLDAVRIGSAETTATIGLQGPHVVLLGQCLDGVTAALNQSAVVDAGASATLAAVAATCEEARSAITQGPPQ